MIEVEIKCKPTCEEKAVLLQGAAFISEECLIDIYFDSESYDLTLKDFWLRTRNDKFVLKIPAASCTLLAKQANSPKHEIEDEQEIRNILKLPAEGTLKQALAISGYTPLYTLTKTRTKYIKSGFTIDVDHAVFENFEFNLIEIETMVETPTEIDQARKNLVAFVQQYGITLEYVPGNLIALIKLVNPKHATLLEKAHQKRLSLQ